MHTEGLLAPTTLEEASGHYEQVGPAAQVVVRETARAMDFDREEYRQRITGEVIETVRDALFASLLSVHVGDREAFETWQDEHPGYDVTEFGSENVSGVVWHPAPFLERAVAATFEAERRAAIDALRRQAFGRLYADELKTDD